MKRIILTMAVLLSVMGMAAQQDAAIKFVASKNKDINAKFLFTQNEVDPVTKKSATMKGTLTFAAPRKMSMIYSDPEGDKFIIDGDNMERKKGQKGSKYNLAKNKMMCGLADLLCNGMMGKVEEIQKATNSVMSYNAGKGTHDFVFTPDKKSKSYLKEVVVKYDKKTGRPVYLKLVEKSGKYNEYNLTVK